MRAISDGDQSLYDSTLLVESRFARRARLQWNLWKKILKKKEEKKGPKVAGEQVFEFYKILVESLVKLWRNWKS
jgi:hypothetical protein